MKSERKKRLKEKKDVEKLETDSTDLYMDNLLDVYYPYRPFCLEKLSLFALCSNYDYKVRCCQKCEKNFNINCCIKIKEYGYFHKRQKIQLIKTPRYSLDNDKNKERYFHQILMLFKPWREESELLNNFDSYENLFTSKLKIKL